MTAKKNIFLIALPVTLFFTPLIFFWNLRLPFAVSQAVFFRVAVEISAIICALIFLSEKKSIRARALVKTPVIFFFLMFATAVFASTVFSVAPVISFFGGSFRLQGFFTFLHYATFAFLVIATFALAVKKKKFILNILWAISLSGTVSAIFGILQKLQLDPFSGRFESSFLMGRVFGTLGHPSFLAGFLILSLGATMVIASKKHIAYIPALLQITALFLTGTRSAFIGFFIFLGIFFLLQARHAKNPRFVKKMSALFFIFPLILFLFAQGLGKTTIANKPAIARLAISEENLRSVESRLASWTAGIRVFAKRPFLGWGPETFEYVAPPYIPAKLANFELFTAKTDRAHNEPIDMLASSGIIGFLSYALLLLAFFFTTARKIRLPDKNTDITLLAGVFASIAGFLFHNQFSFSVIPISAVFWVFLALGFVSVKNPNILKPASKKISGKIKSIITVILITAVSTAGIYANARIAAADYVFAKNDYSSAVKTWPFEPEYSTYNANSLIKEGEFQEALKETEKLWKLNPLNPRAFVLAGKAYTGLGDLSPENYALANEAFSIALTLQPKNPETITEWVKSSVAQKKYTEALAQGEYLLSIAPAYWRWDEKDIQNASSFEKERARVFFKDNPELKKLFENLILASRMVLDHEREAKYALALEKFPRQ